MQNLLSLMVLMILSVDVTAESLTVVGIDISLGMSKSKVYSDFNDYKVSCIDSNSINNTGVLVLDCDSWIITPVNAPYYAIANISFTQNKVTNSSFPRSSVVTQPRTLQRPKPNQSIWVEAVI